jgi:hypothetical protein
MTQPENAPVETATSLLPPASERTSHIERSGRHFWNKRRLAAAGVVGAVAAGLALYPNHGSGQVTVHKAEVFKISPQTIDCRARVSAIVADTASYSEQPKNKLISHIPGLSQLQDEAAKTFAFSSSFRGTNGGGGQIDTLSCIQAAGVEDVHTPGSSAHIIRIPANEIGFLSYVVENQSRVVRDGGNLAMTGAAVWNQIGGPLKHDIQSRQSELDTVAREEAVNVAQQTCGQAAWDQTRVAVEAAYRLIGQQEHDAAVRKSKQQHTTVEAYNPQDVSVIIEGTPTFPPAYSLPQGYPVKYDNGAGGHELSCQVRGNAYQTPDYTKAESGQQMNLTTGQFTQ